MRGMVAQGLLAWRATARGAAAPAAAPPPSQPAAGTIRPHLENGQRGLGAAVKAAQIDDHRLAALVRPLDVAGQHRLEEEEEGEGKASGGQLAEWCLLAGALRTSGRDPWQLLCSSR